MSEISEQEFRAEAAAFLEANAERRRDLKLGWGEGSDRVNLLAEKTPEEERAELDAAKGWKAKEFDAGFSWITGPSTYGGRGLPAAHARAYESLKAGFETPPEQPFAIGLG